MALWQFEFFKNILILFYLLFIYIFMRLPRGVKGTFYRTALWGGVLSLAVVETEFYARAGFFGGGNDGT